MCYFCCILVFHIQQFHAHDTNGRQLETVSEFEPAAVAESEQSLFLLLCSVVVVFFSFSVRTKGKSSILWERGQLPGLVSMERGTGENVLFGRENSPMTDHALSFGLSGQL